MRIPNPPSWQHISNGSNIASGIIKARPEEVEGRESKRKWKEEEVEGKFSEREKWTSIILRRMSKRTTINRRLGREGERKDLREIYL